MGGEEGESGKVGREQDSRSGKGIWREKKKGAVKDEGDI